MADVALFSVFRIGLPSSLLNLVSMCSPVYLKAKLCRRSEWYRMLSIHTPKYIGSMFWTQKIVPQGNMLNIFVVGARIHDVSKIVVLRLDLILTQALHIL